MAFNKQTAAAAGSKGGKVSAAARWGDREPASIRNKHIRLAVSQHELDMIDAKVAQAGISRTELIIRAVEAFIIGES